MEFSQLGSVFAYEDEGRIVPFQRLHILQANRKSSRTNSKRRNNSRIANSLVDLRFLHTTLSYGIPAGRFFNHIP